MKIERFGEINKTKFKISAYNSKVCKLFEMKRLLDKIRGS